MNTTAQTQYAGPFPPLPDSIRAQHPDMFGWEYDKVRPTPDRWEPRGWHVITPAGIHTYGLDGVMYRDRCVYA